MNDYQRAIAWVFDKYHKPGAREIRFTLDDVREAASVLDLTIDNPPDVIYSFRTGRDELPKQVSERAPEGSIWVLWGDGKSKYRAVVENAAEAHFDADHGIAPIKVPDSTPGIISKYAMRDEQALLASIRYNRLLDIYTGIACYSLQSHYRTQIKGWGQAEVDELYVGVDRNGVHYFFPLEAKSIGQRLGRIQVEQGFAIGEKNFPGLITRPIAAQQLEDRVIALYELVRHEGKIGKRREIHFVLVSPEAVTTADLAAYKNLLSE